MKKLFCTLLSTLLAVSLNACSYHAVFVGNSIFTKDRFFMKYSVFTGTEVHDYRFEEDDVLSVDLVSESGSFNLTIENRDTGEQIYAGTELPTSSFTITVPEDGSYRITADAQKAKGSIEILVADEQNATEQ